MNVFKKSVVWLLAAFAIAVFAFCFFGANTYYGDVTTVVIKSADAVDTGNELGRTVRLSLTVPEDEAMTEEQLLAARDVVRQRMQHLSVADYDVTIDRDARCVVVEMPYTSQAVSAVQNLGVKGEFVARKGVEETDGSILFTTANVVSATSDAKAIYGYTIYAMTLNLDDEATAALKTATEELAAEYASSETAQYVSFWYGGQKIAQTSIREVIKNGRIDWTSYSLDDSTFTQLDSVLNSDDMPVGMTTSGAVLFDARDGALSAAYVALGCAFLLATLYLFVKYRVSALVGAICTVGTVGLTFAVITGFMNTGGLAMTLPAFLGVTAVMVLCLYITVTDCASIKKMMAFNSPSKAVEEGMKRNLGYTMRMIIAALIVGLVLMGFQQTGLFYNFAAARIASFGINTSFLTGAGTFGAILFWGALISVAFNVLFSIWMLNSTLSYNGLRKAGCFGGKEDA